MEPPLDADNNSPVWQRLGHALPWLVLAVSLLITMQLWYQTREDARSDLQATFDARVREVTRSLLQRMNVYEQVLHGAQGLFSASRHVEPEEFHIYVERQQLEQHYPGIQKLGYSLIGSHAKTEHAITDMANDLDRAAMERSRDSGHATITGIVQLPAKNGQGTQPGFMMYLPIYKSRSSPDTVTARRAAMIGWVHASFRATDLMANLLWEHADHLDIEIFDGGMMSEKNLLHDSDYDYGNRDHAGYKNIFQLEIAGHTWTVAIRSHPDFEALENHHRTRLVAISGIVISLLLALLTRMLVQGREGAIRVARKMNKELIRSEEHARRLGLLYKMLSEMNSANIHIKDSNQIFDKACHIAVQSGLFRMAWIGLLDPESGTITPVAQAGHIDGYLDSVNINIFDDVRGNGPTGQAIKSGVYVASNDIANDPHMAPWRDEALKRGYRASITCPLKQSGQVIGTFSLYLQDAGSLTEDVIMLLNSMADDISFTLDFIMESTQREKAQHEVNELSMFLQSALENDRKRIARELHDELGQTMTALHFDLKWMQERVDSSWPDVANRLHSMQTLLTRTVDTVRRISEDLRPGMLDDLGLAAALEHHAGKFEAQSGITCDLAMNQTEYNLDEQTATVLFRIVQESLTNVARHSGASHVSIRLQEIGDKILLVIQDDGHGPQTMQPGNQAKAKKTYGLLGMRERVKMLGGTLDIFKEAGAGMRIEACIDKHRTTRGQQ